MLSQSLFKHHSFCSFASVSRSCFGILKIRPVNTHKDDVTRFWNMTFRYVHMYILIHIKPSQVKAGRNMTVFCAHVCSAVAVSAQGPGWH